MESERRQFDGPPQPRPPMETEERPKGKLQARGWVFDKVKVKPHKQRIEEVI
jgi:hypothetical protein